MACTSDDKECDARYLDLRDDLDEARKTLDAVRELAVRFVGQYSRDAEFDGGVNYAGERLLELLGEEK